MVFSALLIVTALLVPGQSGLPTEPMVTSQPTPAGPAAIADSMGRASPTADSAGAAAETEPRRLVPVRRRDRDGSPAALVREALDRPEGSDRSGREVTLHELLVRTVVGAQRAELIRGYWGLWAALADYHFAVDTRQRLQTLVPDKTPAATADPVLSEFCQAALAAAEVRVTETKLAATTAALRLVELQPMLAVGPPPRPADLPHVGSYRTFYERIFAGQRVPAAGRLNATLPIQSDLIRARGAAVYASRRLVSVVTEQFRSDRCPAATLFACHDQLAQRQRGFVAAVLAYNLAIAEYAQMVAPEGVDAAQLVAMLIKSTANPATPTPAEPDGLQSVLRGSPVPDTAGQGPAASAVVPATAEEPVSETDPQTDLGGPGKDQFVPRRLGLEP